MKGNTNEIYSVEGISFSTVEMDRAIARAKEEAKKAKASRKIYLNGNPYALIDKRGIMAAA